jgi:aerotolerance regulator-like protein/VWA domain-containing protein
MGSLGFLSPAFLLGALAIGIPLVLHLLRQRADPVQPFSAVRLLRAAPVEQARRRRLRDLLLFALRAAAIALLALAFARPYLMGAAAADAPVTLVLADVSSSLGGEARTARLRSLALSAIDQAPAGDAVAVARFAATCDLLVAPTPDRVLARAAISHLTPGFAPTAYRVGLDRAAEVLAGRGGRVVLVTDLQAAGWTDGPDASLPPGTRVDVVDVGPVPPDAGIVNLAAGKDSVTAGVRNTGPARSLTVVFDVDGSERARTTVAAGQDQTAQTVAALTVTAGSRLRARISDPNGLPGDDERWLLSTTAAHPRVYLVVSPGVSQQDGLYARRALQALEGDRGVDLEVRTADRLQASGVPPDAKVLLLIGTAGLDRRGAEAMAKFVTSGGGLLVAVGPGLNPEMLAAGFGEGLPKMRMRPSGRGPSMFAWTETRHPALDVFADKPGAFTDVRFTRTVEVLGSGASDVLARFDDGEPAMVATPYGRGRIVVFASDLSNRWNDLVLQPAFVPLIGETVSWLAAADRAPEALVAGMTPLPGADRPGIVTWPARGDAKPRAVAVNVDPREFDPARQTVQEFLARVPHGDSDVASTAAAVAERQEASQGLWRYGLMLMLASLVIESMVGRRV